MFPGSDVLAGVLPVGEIVARSGIDAVVVIGGAPAADHLLVDTQAFVRPHFVARRLVLHMRPAATADLVPFGQPEQIPCCGDHVTRAQRPEAPAAG